MQKHKIPTGWLFVDEYSRGPLETLSIGDYGKRHNVKADFLGYTKEIWGVPNIAPMPLSEKWVVTLSTQYGCPMKCKFCDVPNVEFRGNVSDDDLWAQLLSAITLFPEVSYTERLNIHFARMGEPLFNGDVFAFAEWMYRYGKLALQDHGLRCEVVHPVLSTMLPRTLGKCRERVLEWCDIKNKVYNGQAGLQFSINSTSEEQRNDMFWFRQLSLGAISEIGRDMPMPLGRKYCLNFAYATGNEVDAAKLKRLFNPEKFMVKITPIHNNNACRKNGIETVDGYESWWPYRDIEADLVAAGFDVLVFVPSMDEEDGLVTCGNAVLGGGILKTDTVTENA